MFRYWAITSLSLVAGEEALLIELYLSKVTENSESEQAGKLYARVSYKQAMDIHDMAHHMAAATRAVARPSRAKATDRKTTETQRHREFCAEIQINPVSSVRADYCVDCDGDSDGDGNDLLYGVLNKKESVLE